MGKKAAGCWKDSVKSVSAISWGRSLKDSLGFCVNPKRFLPFLAVDLAALALLISLFGSSADMLTFLAYAESGFPAELASTAAWAVVALFVWVLANLLVSGAVIHQSAKPAEFRASWGVALRCMPSLFAVMLVVTIFSTAASLIPYVGVLISFIVTLSFFLVNQSVVVGRDRFDRALAGSARTFWKKPAAILFTWAVMSIFTICIIGIFSSPMVALLYQQQMAGVSEEALVAMLSGDAGLYYQASVAVMLLGISISNAFGLKFVTGVFLQLRKKKWLFF